MADDDCPRPFVRERNLSNRNYNKRNARRRVSTESHSSVDSSATNDSHTHSTPSSASYAANTSFIHAEGSSSSHSTSSSFKFSYSVNSDTENAFNKNSMRKMLSGTEAATVPTNEPQTPEPALLDVKQKVLHFETLKADERIIFKTGKYQSKTLQSTIGATRVRVLPTSENSLSNSSPHPSMSSLNAPFHTSIDEVRSEDEVDEFSDYEDDVDGDGEVGTTVEYVLPEEATEVNERDQLSPVPGYAHNVENNVNTNALEYSIDDFGKVESTRRANSIEHDGGEGAGILPHSSALLTQGFRTGASDFPRNYRSTPRPKTEVLGTKNRHVVSKFNSFYQPKENDGAHEEEEEEEIELRDKIEKSLHPILEELIKTEETYVENLRIGIENYGNMFQRKDLPTGLRGMKFVLFGNIEAIYEFHRDDFLPMLHRNRRDLKRLFEEFQIFIDKNCFYGYVIYTMNKQKSLKLCDSHKNYFKLLQSELDDKLGINSFLVQPIQRIGRYPLLLKEFIETLFKKGHINAKPLLESCCRLDRKVRTLLTTTNESEIINDIVDCNEFNVFFQGKFRKVSEFNVFDHTQKRTYRSKVFIFDKCIIYTEIKAKSLIFHGRYPCEHVGFSSKTKHFTLFYERRKQQECDFHGDPALIAEWLELMRDMVNSFITEERRKPTNLQLFRDSNRFSSDSGIGNIWVMPRPEIDEERINHRTTWYH